MRILLASAAAFALAACHAPAPAPGNVEGTPNEAAVEAEFENQQAALAASIENDANADDAADDNDSADADGPTAYSCGDNLTVSVAYNADGTASLVADGKTVALKSVPAASGSKYHSDTGLTPGRTLTWWNKGDNAMLIQPSTGAKPGADEAGVKCLATDPDQ